MMVMVSIMVAMIAIVVVVYVAAVVAIATVMRIAGPASAKTAAPTRSGAGVAPVSAASVDTAR